MSSPIKYTRQAATIPPIKANISLYFINCENNTITAIDAKLAPDDIPIIPGSASGFFIVVCKSAPATARFPPIKTALRTLGILRSLIIKKLLLCLFKNIPSSNSLIEMSKLPILKDINIVINKIKTVPSIMHIFLELLKVCVSILLI